eukprot:4545157-Pyramimonas_sp.AAC.1
MHKACGGLKTERTLKRPPRPGQREGRRAEGPFLSPKADLLGAGHGRVGAGVGSHARRCRMSVGPRPAFHRGPWRVRSERVRHLETHLGPRTCCD